MTGSLHRIDGFGPMVWQHMLGGRYETIFGVPFSSVLGLGRLLHVEEVVKFD